MIISARASHLSHTPRKVNLVAKSIIGLSADEALNRLQFTIKRASRPVSLVLKQAIANAGHNFAVDTKRLIVLRAFATKGKTIKKGLFGGRMHYKPIEKTFSHLTIELKSLEPKPLAAAPSAKGGSASGGKVATPVVKLPAKSKISNIKSKIS